MQYQPSIINNTFKLGTSDVSKVEWTLDLIKDKDCDLLDNNIVSQSERTKFLHDFHILEEIANSGEMVVFKALDKKTLETFALKIAKYPSEKFDRVAMKKLIAEQMRDEDADEFFDLSVHHSAQNFFKHGHEITKVWDGRIEYKDKEYLARVEAMEFCTLKDVHEARKALGLKWTYPEFRSCVLQLVRTFTCMEGELTWMSYQVCHRDIKPQNILLNRDLTEYIVTDFGIAEKLEKKSYVPGKLITMTTVGTPGWAGPNVEKALAANLPTVNVEPFEEDVQSLLKVFAEFDLEPFKEEEAKVFSQILAKARTQKMNFTALWDALKNYFRREEHYRNSNTAGVHELKNRRDYPEQKGLIVQMDKKVKENLVKKIKDMKFANLNKLLLVNPELKKRYYEILTTNLGQSYYGGQVGTPVEDIMQFDPNNALFCEQLSRECFHNKRYEDSVSYGRRATELDRTRYWAHFLTGLSLEQLQKYQDAIVEFDKGIAFGLESKNTEVVGNGNWYKAMMLYSQRKYKEAVPAINFASQYCPENITYQLDRCDILTKADDVEAAIKGYQDIIKKWPKESYPCWMLGDLYRDTKQKEAAQKAYTEAYSKKGGSAAATHSYPIDAQWKFKLVDMKPPST